MTGAGLLGLDLLQGREGEEQLLDAGFALEGDDDLIVGAGGLAGDDDAIAEFGVADVVAGGERLGGDGCTSGTAGEETATRLASLYLDGFQRDELL